MLRQWHSHLTETMDPDNGLLGNMFSCNLIDFREMESIRAERTFFDRNELILRKLLQRAISDQEFQKFIQSLKNAGQGHIAAKLLQDYNNKIS